MDHIQAVQTDAFVQLMQHYNCRFWMSNYSGRQHCVIIIIIQVLAGLVFGYPSPTILGQFNNMSNSIVHSLFHYV